MSKSNLMVIFLLFSFINLSSCPFGYSKINASNQSDDLQLIYPNGGETVSGNITIQWSLSSEIIDEVNHYNIYYSPNNGRDWIQIVFAYIITGTSYNWNTELYEKYGTEYLIKIVASSKEWANKEDISAGTFTIDNRNTSPINESLINNPLFLALFSLFVVSGSIGIGYYYYNSKIKQVSFTGLFHLDKIAFLREISHKVIIGLDNIRTQFIEESLDIPSLNSAIPPSSMIEFFPTDFQSDLRSEIRGKTVLTLIEIAYQDPSDTNPVKLANSLNIPLSTLSKEIKKLRSLNYVDTHISNQVIQDARYRNFKITSKGYHFLFVLNTALKVTLKRVKMNGLVE